MSMEFGKLNFSTSFKPTSAFPLDARSYFESYDAAVAAAATAEEAGSSNTTYYYGQTVAVVENSTATLYTIQPDGTLAEVGGKIDVNENAFSLDENGVLDLLGFADAVAGAQLMKSADGKVAWIKPDQTTVEGLQSTVAGLVDDVNQLRTDLDAAQDEIDALEVTVGAKAEGETVATGIFAELDTKANKADVFTKDETTSAIATAVAGASHLVRQKVDSVDAIDTAAEGVETIIYMVAKEGTDGDHFDEYMVIDGAVERVGDWGVDLGDYVKTDAMNTALEGKVDKVDGSRLMTDAEGTKLEGIEDGAQVNVIETVDTAQFAIDEAKNLTLLDIAMGKVTGLVEELDSKVTAAENARLMLDEEGTKLEGIEDGAQVNIIDAVSGEFTISEDGKELSINAIDQSKVTGLPEALLGKVDVVEGKGLSTNDLTDELVEKINASQTNVIEVVKMNGVELPVLTDDKSVDIIIPIANAEAVGTVKSSADENKVSVAEDGTMEVNNINVNKLVQSEGDILILNGGASKL